MDPRHESLEREILNQLIMIVNRYIEENIDDLLNDEIIQREIKTICKMIYGFVGMNIDVDGFLSKHNLLSIDVVLFPLLANVAESRFHSSEKFPDLIAHLKMLIDEHEEMDELNENIERILERVTN